LLVKLTPAIFRLLSVLAVCGLIAAPIARPAIGMTSMAVAGAADAFAVTDDGMSPDMPCCPKQAPVSGCKDCALMATCQLASLTISGEASLVVVPSTARLVPMLAEADLLGHGSGPPLRPPRA
jgi:hypothetical protein